MWFLQHLDPDSPFYIIPEVYRISGELDPAALQAALRSVVRRHEILRTAIREEAGIPWQEVLPSLEIEIPVIDLTAASGEQQEEAVARAVHGESMRPFRLDEPPLFHLTLIRLAPDRHILISIFHHCVSDNWSTTVFLGDLAVYYEGARRGIADPLPRLTVQYADYAVWQRSVLRGEVLASEVGYWKAKLDGVPRCIDLPTDHARPAIQTFNGATVPFSLPEPVGRRLRALAQDESATMFMLLLSAFDLLLYRYTGEHSIAVGTPVANRNAAELEGVIGLFVNTVVMRADIDAAVTFRDLLQSVRTNALEAFAHQEVPFEKLVDALQPDRDLARSPLFQVMFVLQNARASQPSGGPLSIEPMDAHSGTAKFDLTLFMVEQGNECGGVFEYNADLFERDTIERMASHFVHLLDAIGADPDRPVGHLPLTGPLEQRLLLQGGRGVHRPIPEHPFVHEFIAARSAICPHWTAVEDTDSALTYEQLHIRASRIARMLRMRGVAPEARIGLLLPRSNALIVSVLGILEAGGAYVPLDLRFPDDRLAYIVRDAALSAVLTLSTLAPRIAATGVTVVELDRLDEQQWLDAPPCVPLDPENLAYVIYTSGSMGKPKGTLLTHRGLMNYVQWCLEAYPCEAKHTLLHLPLTFDASITALFPPLVAGGTVVLAAEGDERAMPFSDVIASPRPFGFIKLTPAHLEILTHTLPAGRRAEFAEAFVVGGEQFNADQAAPWFTDGIGPVFYNEYGPTEAVVGCVVAAISAATPGSGALPIGRPIPNVTVYVLDDFFHPVPLGVWGELYIAGAGLARGYLNRGDLTAWSFIPDPYGRPGGRMYRSGDVVRYLPDGTLEFRGRRDSQVKFHGYRIEPGEIEGILRTDPAVQDAVVCVKHYPGGEPRLVAYYTLMSGGHASPGVLRTRLEAQLPVYMIPSAYIELGEIPLTSHGKVDRAALPLPGVQAPSSPATTAPRSAAEEVLARIWSDVLSVKDVGIDDNFFALGGDSILAIQVLARAAQAGMMLTAAQMFRSPTVRELAVHAEETLAVTPEEGMLEGDAPLMPVQAWFFEQRFREPSHWNQSVMLPLDEQLDLEQCRTIVRTMMERHDVLRMRFAHDGEGWRQYMVGSVDHVPVVEEDLSDAGEGEGLAEVIIRRSTHWQASLDIECGPPVRVVLYHTRAGDRLLIVIHHLVVDAVSWAILLEDLRVLYSAKSDGSAAPLPPRTVSYRQWATRLRHFTERMMTHEETEYWRAVAGTAPVELFPVAGRSLTEAADGNIEYVFDLSETQLFVHEITIKLAAPIQNILLAVLARVLGHRTAGSPVWIDVESHGRQEFERGVSVDRTVGWFTSIWPVALASCTDGTCLEAVHRVNEQLSRIPGQGRGFGLLRAWSPSQDLRTALRALPAPQVIFNYLGQSSSTDEREADEDRLRGKERADVNERTHVLEVNARVSGGRLHMAWQYTAGVLDAGSIHLLIDRYAGAVHELVRDLQQTGAGAEAAARDFGWTADDVRAIVARIRRSHDDDDE
jgi:amino acid adenylation domain-containing protein/non-ribosomal peptide synthase protein (TIGR01720 family)